MNKKIQKLLAVLDLPEEEQRNEVTKLISPAKAWKHSYHLWEGAHGDCPLWECDKCERKILREKLKAMPWDAPVRSGKCNIPDSLNISLADLAFRLRDEVEEFCWEKAKVLIWSKYYPIANEKIGGFQQKLSCTNGFFTSRDMKSIHWIIAALIAKELAKDGKDNSGN